MSFTGKPCTSSWENLSGGCKDVGTQRNLLWCPFIFFQLFSSLCGSLQHFIHCNIWLCTWLCCAKEHHSSNNFTQTCFSLWLSFLVASVQIIYTFCSILFKCHKVRTRNSHLKTPESKLKGNKTFLQEIRWGFNCYLLGDIDKKERSEIGLEVIFQGPFFFFKKLLSFYFQQVSYDQKVFPLTHSIFPPHTFLIFIQTQIQFMLL